jgi:hypothetical protein
MALARRVLWRWRLRRCERLGRVLSAAAHCLHRASVADEEPSQIPARASALARPPRTPPTSTIGGRMRMASSSGTASIGRLLTGEVSSDRRNGSDAEWRRLSPQRDVAGRADAGERDPNHQGRGAKDRQTRQCSRTAPDRYHSHRHGMLLPARLSGPSAVDILTWRCVAPEGRRLKGSHVGQPRRRSSHPL